MRKKILLLLIFYLLIFQINLFASENVVNKTYLKNLVFGYNDSYFNDDVFVTFENEGKIVGGLKSYKKAILYSALVPGAGEIYTGSLIKGLAFIGVEALCWSVYFTSNNKGEDIKDEFHLYSDTHWSKDEYEDGLRIYREQHNGADPPNLTHDLPETKTQQYYEMTGKYNQFAVGWDDCDEWDGLSENRLKYEDKRYQSNKYLKRAINMTSIIFLNRVISLVDTIWGVKLYNEKIRSDKIISLIPVSYKDEIIPAFCLKFNW